ncbi:hypothetical protein L3Y34_011220 [Caenorhabditis briggsae]|uniref:Uncharacterized protein n=1 Tax=Caenorhabditis briggsae TaxID=6238 RepID=A0AAE8ZPM4_CAEBR|nr:hypothetical protein L3Y34_011220 [Caenorhabditis briggsae]
MYATLKTFVGTHSCMNLQRKGNNCTLSACSRHQSEKQRVAVSSRQISTSKICIALPISRKVDFPNCVQVQSETSDKDDADVPLEEFVEFLPRYCLKQGQERVGLPKRH